MKQEDGILKRHTISSAIDEYCNKIGLDLKEVGFKIGRMATDDRMDDLSYILQLHFFAGVHFGVCHRNEVNIKNLTKPISVLRAKTKDQNNYVG